MLINKEDMGNHKCSDGFGCNGWWTSLSGLNHGYCTCTFTQRDVLSQGNSAKITKSSLLNGTSG